MWKAEKIELLKMGDPDYPTNQYDDSWMVLKINGESICDTVINIYNTKQFYEFQSNTCDYCGEQGCNPGNYLRVKKHLSTLLFIPSAYYIEDFDESDFVGCDGPPDKWYLDGCLIVENEALKALTEMIPGLSLDRVDEITEEELKFVDRWERLVKEKPKGFRHPYYLKDEE